MYSAYCVLDQLHNFVDALHWSVLCMGVQVELSLETRQEKRISMVT